MSNLHNRIHIFEGYGVEVEYMIVDRDTLRVKAISDELLKHKLNTYAGDFENGMITWSNELVLHVIELKSTKPESNLTDLGNAFAENVKSINDILDLWNGMLMPTGAHPFMDPLVESRLWPHDNNEIYAIYNSLFDCRGHGWSNLQSTHLNLPFYDDHEFSRLHAAIRLVLPLLPALCASTPVLDGKITGELDTRLQYYKTNQSKIPSITGRVIPEPVFSEADYSTAIYSTIQKDISPYNATQILEPLWVNSRGAIARFDRGSIEIRIMDSQECPAADMATLGLVIETIKALVREDFIDHKEQMKWKTEPLAQLLNETIIHAQDSVIKNGDYLHVFGVSDPSITARELWQHILTAIEEKGNFSDNDKNNLQIILKEGTLAQRIVNALSVDSSISAIRNTYRQLCECLHQNSLFIP